MNRSLKQALALWSVCLLSGSVPALGTCLTPPGDLDGSGVSNVVDVQCDILLALWELSTDEMAPPPSCLHVSVSEADVNCDGANNVTDVLLLIQFALNVPIDSSIDVDGDGCLRRTTPASP